MRTEHNEEGTKATPEFSEGEAMRTQSEGKPRHLTEPQQFAIIIVLTFLGTLTAGTITSCLILGLCIYMTVNIAKKLHPKK